MLTQLQYHDYMVVWLCALRVELAAAQEMLDDKHDTPLSETLPYMKLDFDYICGRVGEHNVVIICLKDNQTDTYSPNTIIEKTMRAFTSLRIGLMVGTGGGVPSEGPDIRLGDVVVGRPFDGVVQYDSKHLWFLRPPPPVLRKAIRRLEAEQERGNCRLDKYFSRLDGPFAAIRKAAGPDTLYTAIYDHQGGETCQQCDKSYIIDRKPRSQEVDVVVHYGTIASGYRIIESGLERDELSVKLGGVLCFDTAIAGLKTSFPCLVIRGISDYADSHRSKEWQKYAAATATAYAKEVLSVISTAEVVKEKRLEKLVSEQEYGTIEEIIGEMMEDHYVNFDSITWEWELPSIPASDMESDVVLVCTSSSTRAAGDFTHVHASTYWEYLKQSRWADFIMETLGILTQSGLELEHGGFSMYAMTNPPVWITCSLDNLSINFSNKQTCLQILDLVKVLDWLCKSMRRPTNKDDGHLVSSASYRLGRAATTESSVYGLPRSSATSTLMMRPYVRPKMSPLPGIKHSCWLSFFDACVIVDSPFTLHNGFGKGLELSFDLMIALAASELCLKINGSLVFLGYRTVLYPVAVDGNCAQFHLITTTHGQINPYTLTLENILPAEESSHFRTMRCFVGWCEDAHINLGTRYLTANISYTGGQDHPRSLESDGYALLSQFGASAPVSAIAGVQKNFKYSRHRIRFTPTENYSWLLHDASQQPVVLYDSKQRRCWLVPKLSLLLHMAQRHNSCSTGGMIPYAEPHMDAQDLIPILDHAGQINVLGQANPLKLQELLFALSTRMLNTAEAMKESGRGNLYGFEFMDIVRNPDRGSCIKKLSIQPEGKAWLDLVNVVGTVVVCSELGEVISVEGSSTRKCEKCNRVPENKDYFTATIPCLAQLAKEKAVDLIVGGSGIGIKFSDKAIWKLDVNPLTICTHAENSKETCWERPGLIQKVTQLGGFDWATFLRPSKSQLVQEQPVQSRLVKGAVVFG